VPSAVARRRGGDLRGGGVGGVMVCGGRVAEEPSCANGGVGAHGHLGAVRHEESQTIGLGTIVGR
jgi:hypothetical protein